jgi:NADPH-dependent glutamate synthase beta subunit-like oxidoreductase
MSGKQTRSIAKAPCREACPAGIDVPRYVRLIRDGRFAEALAVIHERIPFSLVCGYTCAHPCEAKCARLLFDEAIAIRQLKRVVAEKVERKAKDIVKRPPTGRKVAVIGSGPCGLTAAHYLNVQGHAVKVFEALARPGGMLRYSIPDYRLPEDVLDREIDLIREGGVEIVTGTRVPSARSLLENGFAAVLVATGAWKPTRMGIEGEGSASVIDGISFLREVNEGKAPAIGSRVIVVGGGNTAIDAARASIRLGSEVELIYRRTRTEMPASIEEILEAAEEGVNIKFLTTPVKIEADRVVCIRMQLGEADASGRRAPVKVAGSEHSLEFDTLIMAVGQGADAASMELPGRKNGTVSVAGDTLATDHEGVFAAGDAVTGSSSIITAIAQGRVAAESIDRFLGGTGAISGAEPEEADGEQPETATRGARRLKAGMLGLRQRRTSFAPVELAYEDKAAIAEASRCLSCDLRDFEVVVNGAVCKDCGYCREVCSLGVFEQAGEFNALGYRPAVAAHTDKCIGCLRCLYICPDFAIKVKG